MSELTKIQTSRLKTEEVMLNSGNQDISGNKNFTGNLTVGGQGVLTSYANRLNGSVTLGVGTNWNDAPSLSLYGPNTTSGIINGFQLRAGANDYALTGKSDGTLTWGGKNILTSGNGTFVLEKNSSRPDVVLRRTDINSSIDASSGTQWMGVIRYGFSDATCAYVEAGKNTSNQNFVQIVATNDNSTYYNLSVRGDGVTNAPTPTSATDNSTKIATTAWYQKSRREGNGVGIPNYSAGVSVTNNYTFTANGVIKISMYWNGSKAQAYLDGKEVYYWSDDGNSHGTSYIIVKKGQKFTCSNGLEHCTFYPFL